MAVKIKLTDRQRKLAADEMEGLDSDTENLEGLRDAGFEFDEGDETQSDSGNAGLDAGDNDGREYIDDGVIDDGNNSASGNDGVSNLPEWVDDDVRDYAASYGISEEDLSDFGSFAQLQRVGTMLDRRFTMAAAQGEQDGQQSSQQSGQQALSGSGENQQVTGGSGKEGKDPGPIDRLKPLDRNRYVEAKYGDAELDLVDQLNATIEAVRQFMPGLQQQAEQQLSQQQEAMERDFHKSLDDLDPEIYGKAMDGDKLAGRLNPAFEENRRAVRETMVLLQRGIVRDAEQRGVQPEIPSVRALAMRAAKIVEQAVSSGNSSGSAQSRTQASRQQQAVDQSRKRRPVGTGGRSRGTVSGGTSGSGKSTSGSGSSEADDVKQILNSPAISQFWKQTQRENGVT